MQDISETADNGELHEPLKLIPHEFSPIDMKDKYGRTMLHYAAIQGDLGDTDMQSSLIEVKDEDGRTMLHYAAIQGHIDVADKLVRVHSFGNEPRNTRKNAHKPQTWNYSHKTLISYR